jgi:hypothetical protein
MIAEGPQQTVKRTFLRRNKMKKSITVCLVVLFAASIAHGQFTLYTDRSSWEAAVVSYQEENFDDATLNDGVTIDSDFGGSVAEPGYVGMWYDRVSKPPESILQETTISFSSEIYAFGGNWDLAAPTGPGKGIIVSLDGTPINSLTIDNDHAGDFWGVVSTVPFSEVLLQADGEPEGIQETFTLDDMVYSVVLAVEKELTLINRSDEWDLDPTYELPLVPTHTALEFEMVITITNNTLLDITNLVVEDRLGGDLEFISASPPPLTPITKGNSDKVFLEWGPVTLAADSYIEIILTVATDVNPGTGNNKKPGKQEYTSEGIHDLNSGANAKGLLGGEVQVSASSGSVSVYAEDE